FSFLKYLCIVLPGSILGDLLVSNKDIANNFYTHEEQKKARMLALLGLAFVIFHVVTLYMRLLGFNLVGHVVFGILFLLFFTKNREAQFSFYTILISW